MYVDSSILDFGNDNGDEEIDDEDFLNETRMTAKTEFDNAIKVWIRNMPNWKASHQEDLGKHSAMVVKYLHKIYLKVLIEDFGENHH